MASKSNVTKFFEDNAARLSPQSDPVAHNTNAGLLALTNYLASELAGLHNEVSQLKSKIDHLEHQVRQR
jgi:hypothetical protein